MACKYKTEGSDYTPLRMVPKCACGWSGEIEDGQDALANWRSLQQWQMHVEERMAVDVAELEAEVERLKEVLREIWELSFPNDKVGQIAEAALNNEEVNDE